MHIASPSLFFSRQQTGEGLVYGLLTTISNLSVPFARAIGNQIYGLFEPDLSDSKNYIRDAPEFRSTVAWSFALSYGFALVSIVFVGLLPPQKLQAQQRKEEWPKHIGFAYVTIALVLTALAYSLTVNVMTMIPATACLQFVGGRGC